MLIISFFEFRLFFSPFVYVSLIFQDLSPIALVMPSPPKKIYELNLGVYHIPLDILLVSLYVCPVFPIRATPGLIPVWMMLLSFLLLTTFHLLNLCLRHSA